ncbi:MAG: hypothetical protein M1833_003891 [Piccolia ochrophora]|nr:MAG: hypothetical protein M1833_003891 [Piccolia ochrophora]
MLTATDIGNVKAILTLPCDEIQSTAGQSSFKIDESSVSFTVNASNLQLFLKSDDNTNFTAHEDGFWFQGFLDQESLFPNGFWASASDSDSDVDFCGQKTFSTSFTSGSSPISGVVSPSSVVFYIGAVGVDDTNEETTFQITFDGAWDKTSDRLSSVLPQSLAAPPSGGGWQSTVDAASSQPQATETQQPPIPSRSVTEPAGESTFGPRQSSFTRTKPQGATPSPTLTTRASESTMPTPFASPPPQDSTSSPSSSASNTARFNIAIGLIATQGDGKRLSAGAQAGIAIGTLAAVALIALIILLIYRRRRQRLADKSPAAYPELAYLYDARPVAPSPAHLDPERLPIRHDPSPIAGAAAAAAAMGWPSASPPPNRPLPPLPPVGQRQGQRQGRAQKSRRATTGGVGISKSPQLP